MNNDVEAGVGDDQGVRSRKGKWASMKKALSLSKKGEKMLDQGRKIRPGGLSDLERQSALTMLMLVILLGELITLNLISFDFEQTRS